MIKVDVKENNKEITFPVLMQSCTNGNICLFNSPTTCILLQKGASSNLVPFSYQEGMIEASDSTVWEKYDGTITLSNQI